MAAVAAITCAAVAQGMVGSDPALSEARSDLVIIDTLKHFGPLDRPPVVFMHDAHTRALAPKGKDCQSCHLTDEKGVRSLKFRRLLDSGRREAMDAYHVECISCHRETRSAGEKSGPETCGECHRGSEVVSDRTPMGFDLSLHYRHAKAQENKCEACHHAYNPQTKKLFYDKGKEGTCRYCHKETTEENRIAMPQAAHLACIACHQKTLAMKKDSGPLECSGCHDPEVRQMIEKVADLPRLQRNQPDVVFVSTVPPDMAKADDPPASRMNAVPFDHLTHERANDTCRVCHHAEMYACSSCHTPTGAEKGGFVSLKNAMHRFTADASCMGCHATRQAEPKCAACHASRPKALPNDPAVCQDCHMQPVGGTQILPGPMQASLMLGLSKRTGATYPAVDIPETVVIKALSKDYEPVQLPHRKIVAKLTADIRDDRLAAHFHSDPGTICQGCHHNSPASKTPPQCGSCHGKPFEGGDGGAARPGLTAAYHRQCMECHEILNLAKPDSRDCTSCHIKKKTW